MEGWFGECPSGTGTGWFHLPFCYEISYWIDRCSKPVCVFPHWARTNIFWFSMSCSPSGSLELITIHISTDIPVRKLEHIPLSSFNAASFFVGPCLPFHVLCRERSLLHFAASQRKVWTKMKIQLFHGTPVLNTFKNKFVNNWAQVLKWTDVHYLLSEQYLKPWISDFHLHSVCSVLPLYYSVGSAATVGLNEVFSTHSVSVV